MKRDPRMIALAIIAPMIVTGLFGSVFGGELRHLRVIVINEDKNFNSVLGEKITDAMQIPIPSKPSIWYNVTSERTVAQAAVTNNYSQAAIIYPKEFTEDLLLGKPTEVTLYISYENPALAEYVLGLFEASSTQIMEEYFGNNLLTITVVPLYKGSTGALPSTINISLCNLDEGWTDSKFSTVVYEILAENDTVAIEKSNDLKEAESLVKKGDARAIIIFSEDFTYDALTKKKINIEVKLDGAEPQSCLAIKGVISAVLAEAFGDTFDRSSFNVDEYFYNNRDSTGEQVKSITYFTPAILCFVVFFFSFMLTMLSFLRERNQGTMERILTSPLKRSELIIGYVLSFSILALLEATTVLIATIFIFDAQIEFSILALFQAYLIIYLIVFGALGLGIFLSTLAKTEFQIVQFVPLIIMPFMLLSGVWSPIETLPDWLRPLSAIIPLTYSNSGMRDILIRGESLLDILPQIGFLAIFDVVMIALGVLKLNKKLK